MGLIDRVAGLVRGWRKPEARTTAEEMRRPVQPLAELQRFAAETERRKVVEACQKMYATDTRAKRSIRTLARDIVRGGFVVKVVGNEEAEEVARALQERLDLGARLDDWVRMAIRDGDSFLEVSINEQMEVGAVTRKPTLQMRRNSDERDRFLDATKAFWWADEVWIGQAPPGDAVWFAEWQIVHARWDHDAGSRYGTPMFAAGTGAWKRVVEGEVDIAIRRKTRAGMKYVHVLEGASESELQAYKEANKDALNNPFAAVADFFMNRRGALEVVQGDARLGEIGDVVHQIATWMMASDVPLELLGYGENLNRDVLEEKKKEYDETLEQFRPWVEAEILKPLFELQWMLAGIWPAGLMYEFQWTGKQLLRPADLKDVADAALKLRALGVTDEALWGILGRFLAGVDVEMLMGQAEEQEGTPAAIAGAMTALSDQL